LVQALAACVPYGTAFAPYLYFVPARSHPPRAGRCCKSPLERKVVTLSLAEGSASQRRGGIDYELTVLSKDLLTQPRRGVAKVRCEHKVVTLPLAEGSASQRRGGADYELTVLSQAYKHNLPRRVELSSGNASDQGPLQQTECMPNRYTVHPSYQRPSRATCDFQRS